HLTAARSNFDGSASAYSKTRSKASSSDSRPISRAANSAWNTQRPSIARVNLVRGFPCAVTALPVGPDGDAQPNASAHRWSRRHLFWRSPPRPHPCWPGCREGREGSRLLRPPVRGWQGLGGDALRSSPCEGRARLPPGPVRRFSSGGKKPAGDGDRITRRRAALVK